MKIAFALLLLSVTLLRAQETNAPPEFLFIRGYDVATNLLALVDQAYGYPNSETKTERATEAIQHPVYTNLFIVRLDILPIHSPRFKRGLHLKERLQERLTTEQWSLLADTNVTKRVFARLTEANAVKLGFFKDTIP